MRHPYFGANITVRRIALLSVLMILLAGATGVVLPSMAAGGVGREVTIVAKNMAFVVESPASSKQTNPTITVSAGRRITIIFRNDDPGMQHDLVIEGLHVQVEVISFGETTRLTFTAPSVPGKFAYICSFHPRSMRGVFIVH
jgi:plastocyanin